jgi:hypothetical protein
MGGTGIPLIVFSIAQKRCHPTMWDIAGVWVGLTQRFGNVLRKNGVQLDFSRREPSMSEPNLMGGEKSDFQRMIEKILANREWLDQHIDELVMEYGAGEWIAISDEKVIARGSNSEEVKAAIGGGSEEALIICVPDKDIAQPI